MKYRLTQTLVTSCYQQGQNIGTRELSPGMELDLQGDWLVDIEKRELYPKALLNWHSDRFEKVQGSDSGLGGALFQ